MVVDLLDSQGVFEIEGLTDLDSEKRESKLFGYPILGGDEVLPRMLQRGVNLACLGLGSINAENNVSRYQLFQKLIEIGFVIPNLKHPQAIVSKFCQWGQGITVMAGAIINPGVNLADNVLVNTGALVEHDCILEQSTHISPGAKLAGAVTVREGAYVGLGATIRQGIEIGPWSTVGAGAVVVQNVPAGITVAGVPAQPLDKHDASN